MTRTNTDPGLTATQVEAARRAQGRGMALDPIHGEAPAGIDLVLWRLSSPEERRELVASSGANDPVTLAQADVADANEVSAATDRIVAEFDYSRGNEYVGSDAVRVVAEEFAALNPASARALFEILESRDLIAPLADEIKRARTIHSLSDTELTAFYDDLAGKLDGGQLARFSTVTTAETQTRMLADRLYRGEIVAVATSVADNADAETALAFIEALSADTLESDALEGPAPDPDATPDPDRFDIEGAAIGIVIAGLDDESAVQRAIAGLSDDELRSVIASSTRTDAYARGAPADASRYEALATAVATIDSGTAEGVEQVGRFVGTSMDLVRADPVAAAEVGVKDGLSRIMTAHLSNLLNASLSDGEVIRRGFGEDIQTFAQTVLFTEPSGELQKSAAVALRSSINSLLNVWRSGENAQFYLGTSLTNPLSPDKAANVGGQLLARTLNGAQLAIERDASEAGSNAILVNLIIDVAVDQIPAANQLGEAFSQLDGTLQSLYKRSQGLSATEIKARVAAGTAEVDPSGFDDLYWSTLESIGEGYEALIGEESDFAYELQRSFGDGFTIVRPVDVRAPD